MEPPAGVAASAVGAIEPDYVVILIFHPDTAQEAAFPALFLRRDVKHQAADFAKEFAAHVIELVVLFVESVRVDEDHLQEAVGHKLQRERKEIPNRSEDLLALALGVLQGNQRDAFREVR